VFFIYSGQVYASPAELWEAVARNDTSASHAQGPAWYKAAVDYWDAQEASVNGVLGGYGFVSAIDVRDSRSFLLKAFGEVLHISNTGEVNSDTPPLVALGRDFNMNNHHLIYLTLQDVYIAAHRIRCSVHNCLLFTQCVRSQTVAQA